jgi:glycosyltransferase involved in cell wall biosynthesis
MNLRFSVIVPTYQRPAAIVDCIKALTLMRYPKDRFEVIVVDDGSSEPVEAAIGKFGRDVQLRVIRQPNAGPAAARNAGVRIARGEYLAFTDDDCMPDGEWLNAFDGRFQAQPQACVGGQVANGFHENPYSVASHLVSEHVREFFTANNSSLLFFPTNNIAFPAAGLRQIGGFLEKYRLVAAEDREICYRWIAAGGSLVWEPRAQVIHAHDLMLRQFLTQHFTYGRGAYHYYQERAAWDDSWPCPRLRFYLGLLGKPVRQFHGFPALRLVALLGLSQMATAAGYLRERMFCARPVNEKNSQ